MIEEKTDKVLAPNTAAPVAPAAPPPPAKAEEPPHLLVSYWPHIRDKESTPYIMRQVLWGLFPAALAALWFFGLAALAQIATCILFAVGTEAAFQAVTRRPIRINDLSAVVTGLLLAFCLPPTLPLWISALGAIFAIFVVKQLFGGLGFNIFNPAISARAFLVASWPVAMTTWLLPVSAASPTWRDLPAKLFSLTSLVKLDGLTGATPLGIVKEPALYPNAAFVDILGKIDWSSQWLTYKTLFLGNIGGCLGETSALALLLGAAFLLWKKIISWPIPVSYLGTVAVMALLLGRDPIFHLLSGGLMLGAFFMATDYVTSPLTQTGRLIFGLGCGVITMLIRCFGGYPEGVAYSILLMNALTPIIDVYIKPTPLGQVKPVKVKKTEKT